MLQGAQRFRSLDALRGIAALMVFAFHLTLWRSDWPGFALGSTGVHLFFMISGFVIFMTLDQHHDARRYAIGRISRLYPIYWIVVTITFVARLIESAMRTGDAFADVSFTQYLANLTMFQTYFGFEQIDGQYWTLAIEMMFYVLMLLVFILGALRYAIPVVACVSILSACASNYEPLYQSISGVYMQLPLLKFLPFFGGGMAFYRIYQNNQVTRNILWTLLCFISALMLYRPDWYIFISRIQYSSMLILFFGLFTILRKYSPLMIANSCFINTGKISYSLYLAHNFIFCTWLCGWLIATFQMPLWVAAFVISMPAGIAFSWLLSKTLEYNSQRWFRNLLERLFPVDHAARRDRE